jgi:CheY-like chemotaxis protein
VNAAAGAAPTVLLAEDDRDLAAALAGVLAEEGYAVRRAADGLAALAAVAAAPPDLVLSDIGLPGLDGRALARHLRARWPALPVVLMSAEPDPAPAGVAGFLRKPFNVAELLDLVARALAQLPAAR